MISHKEEQEAYTWYDELDDAEQERLICQWIRKHYEKNVLPYKEDENA